MSWKVMNQILGMALVDQQFWKELKEDPIAVCRSRGLELTPEEEAVLSRIHAETLTEFSQRLLDEFSNQDNRS